MSVETRIWERDATLAAISGLLGEAREGHGRSLFIAAEAGLGKTTMLERTQALAQDHFRIGLGRADAAESTLPFGIVDQALRALGFKGVLGSGGPSARSGLAARASQFFAALRFLDRQRAPTLLLLDDLHWADDDSLALLSHVCRRIGTLPVAVLGTLRPWPAAALDVAQSLSKDGDGSLELLQPLTTPAVTALLGDRLGRPVSTASALRAASLTSGNPLLLEQIALDMRRGERSAHGRSSGGALESRLLRSRFAGVSPNELRYVQAASVLGSRFRPAMVSQIAGLGAAEGERALEALSLSGLFRADTAGPVQFAHPMLRQVVYDEVAAPVRRRWHALAFRLLVAASADAAEAAEHASRADLDGDPEAIAVLAQAGRAAMRAGAIARARQRLHAAVQVAGNRAPADLLMDLGEVQLVSGDSRAAAATCRRVLAGADLNASIRTRAERMMGRALFVSGAIAEADDAFRAAVQSAPPNDRADAVEALLDQAFISWPTGGPALAMPLLEQARKLAADAPASLRVRSETAWGFTAFIRGDPAGIAVVDGAVGHAFANPEADTADFAWSWGTLGTYGNVAKWSERWAEATKAYDVGMAAAERLGLPVAIAAVAVMHADTCLRTGQLRLAMELADRAALLADLAPERAFWAAIAQAYVLAEIGRMDECGAQWKRASQLADPAEGWAGNVWLWHVEAVLAMHARQTAVACTRFDQLRALAHRLELNEPCIVPWAGDAITAYLYGGRLDAALEVIASLDATAGRLPCRYPRIVVAGARAALAQAQGDLAETERLLHETATLAAASGMPVVEARTLIRLGAFLRRTRRELQARPLLRRAVELAETCGAESVAAKAREENAAAGGRRQRRRANPDDLTAAESRVVSLLEHGLTTRQIAGQLFVTVNTVETHLQHIYRKLGVNSARELLARLRRGAA